MTKEVRIILPDNLLLLLLAALAPEQDGLPATKARKARFQWAEAMLLEWYNNYENRGGPN